MKKKSTILYDCAGCNSENEITSNGTCLNCGRNLKTQHMATPWSVVRDGNNEICIANQWGYIASLGLPKSKRQNEDAAFIVRAVNAHEELLAALRVLHARSNCCSIDESGCPFAEAFAKAEGLQ